MIWKKNKSILDGTVGVIKPGVSGDLETTTGYLTKAMSWLKANNHLYQRFLSQAESIRIYCSEYSVNTTVPCFPKWTEDMEIAHGGQLHENEIEKLEGLLLPSCQFIRLAVPTPIQEITIGEVIEKPSDPSDVPSPKEFEF